MLLKLIYLKRTNAKYTFNCFKLFSLSKENN